MKNVIITLTSIIAGASMAKAELGDTYATSCNRFGGTGYVDKATNTISWQIKDIDSRNSNWLVTEQFRNNQCVMITYTYAGTEKVAEGAIWQTLSRNSTDKQIWHEYPDAPGGQRGFATTDNQIYGAEWTQGGLQQVRVAYRSWLERHHLLESPNNTPPPVEENNNNNSRLVTPVEEVDKSKV
jgi:hypothetical protein